MNDNVFIGIDHEALYNKSKVYISRALTRKQDGNHEEYQLWASLAFELLGKAALARKHPSLVVDPTHWQSLFVAAGVHITTDVKTITAKTLFERLTHLVPRFDQTLQKFCQSIAERRNAELHSAEVPFKTMRLEAWEERYWHVCDTVLNSMNASLETWLGATDARAPLATLEQARIALGAAITLRVQAAASEFNSKKKSERDLLVTAANIREPHQQLSLFNRRLNVVWPQQCPACGCRAFIAGRQTSEDFSEESDESGVWEIVDREFEGDELICPTCSLNLTSTDEIEAAGLESVYSDQIEREMEYEPDYGND